MIPIVRLSAIVLVLALAFLSPVLALEFTATEVLGLRAGTGPGKMGIVLAPDLANRFAVDSQGRLLLLDFFDGPGAVSVYAPNGKFLQRIPAPRPKGRRGPARTYHLFVDGADNIYVEMSADQRLRKFDPAGRFLRDFDYDWGGARWVDRRGHIFMLSYIEKGVRELGPDGALLREVRAKDWRDILVDTEGQILFQEGPTPPGIPLAPEIEVMRGRLFRDRAGNYYWNGWEDGICADLYKNGPDRQPLGKVLTHVELMERMQYPYQRVVYLHEELKKTSTTGGRYCTLGWYLSFRDELYAVVASDSVPRRIPWLRIVRIEIR